MATISIDVTVPNADVADMKSAINYRDQIQDPANPGQTIANPVTVKAFVAARVANDLNRALTVFRRRTEALVTPITGA
jgi:hypothetical protein